MDVSSLIIKKDEAEQTIYLLENDIKKLKCKIKQMEKQIFNNCNHEWKYDNSCSPYDRIKYKCKKCNLWRNRYMYQ